MQRRQQPDSDKGITVADRKSRTEEQGSRTEEQEAASEEIGLDPWARVASGIIAVVLMLVTGYYTLWPRMAQAPGPECADLPGCTVTINAPVDGVIVAAFLVLTALFTLMALTGLVWVPSFGNGAAMAPYVKATAESSTYVPPGVDSKKVSFLSGLTESVTPEAARARVDEALKLWNTLPADMQDAATTFGGENWNASRENLQQNIIEVAHESGQGSKPYYAKFLLDGKERVVKLTKGGRGKKGVTTRHDDR